MVRRVMGVVSTDHRGGESVRSISAGALSAQQRLRLKIRHTRPMLPTPAP